MGSYKANKNNKEEIGLTEEERAKKNNKKNIENGIEVMKAVDEPHVKAIGYAAKGLHDLTNGKSTEEFANIATKINQSSPMGKRLQGVSNKASESGLSDTAGKAASLKNGKTDIKTGATDKTSTTSKIRASLTSSKGSSGKNISSLVKGKNGKISPLKIKILFFVAIAFFVLILIVGVANAATDFYNLALTNETVLASSSAGSRLCTNEEIGKRIIYVGDSRTVGLKDALSNIDTTKDFIGKAGSGYSWLNSSAINDLKSKLTDNEQAIVIFNFGINDLDNIDNYIAFYTSLLNDYPNNKFYFMSVNPVDEERGSGTYSVTNDQIEEFNQKMLNAFPDKYLDVYNNVIGDISTEDGVLYTKETYQNIHDFTTNLIASNSNIICSTGSISSIDLSSLSGGSGRILRSGESLLSILGQEKINSWNVNLKNDIQSAGIGSGAAPAVAAYGLVQGALNEGIIIPYFWGGGHGVISDGINPSWGAGTVISAGGSGAQPAGSIQPSGLDCSGFVSWALKNGGCSNFSPIAADGFKSLGSGISANDAIPGDIAASSSHVMIILNNTGSNLIVAEAKSAKYGIVFSSYDYSHFSKYKVVSMRDYYSKNCNG